MRMNHENDSRYMIGEPVCFSFLLKTFFIIHDHSLILYYSIYTHHPFFYNTKKTKKSNNINIIIDFSFKQQHPQIKQTLNYGI